MKILLAVVLVVVNAIGLTSEHPSGESLRNEVHQRDISEDQLRRIVSASINPQDAISLGYHGLCEAMLAEHVFLPTSKWNHFKEGRSKIEMAIGMNASNPELRYIRLLLELNTPPFLGFSDNVSSDLSIFVLGCEKDKVSAHWRKQFGENLLKCKHITEEQVELIEKTCLRSDVVSKS